MAKAAKKTSNKVPGPVTAEQAAEQKAVAGKQPQIVPQRQKPTAKPHNYKQAEFVVVENVHYCEPGDTVEDGCRPEYWCHVAAKTPAMSRITMINRTKGWEAYFRVVETGKGMLKVVLLGAVEWKMIAAASDEAARLRNLYSIEERPDGWRVKNAQGESVSGGLVSKQAAEEWITVAVQALTAQAA